MILALIIFVVVITSLLNVKITRLRKLSISRGAVFKATVTGTSYDATKLYVAEDWVHVPDGPFLQTKCGKSIHIDNII
jgi:hypothetical protein